MARALLFVLFVSAVIITFFPGTSVEARRCCGKNSVWNDCGTACPLTCEHPGARACTKQCVPGCTCVPGTLLGRDGQCYKPFQCW